MRITHESPKRSSLPANVRLNPDAEGSRRIQNTFFFVPFFLVLLKQKAPNHVEFRRVPLRPFSPHTDIIKGRKGGFFFFCAGKSRLSTTTEWEDNVNLAPLLGRPISGSDSVRRRCGVAAGAFVRRKYRLVCVLAGAMSAVVLLVGFLSLFSNSEAESTVQIGVYYESMCPDSAVFVEQQLKPTYGKISDYMNVELIPYGNANFKGKHDQWTFTCQHGPEECYGNMVQACYITLVNNTSSQIDFVNCAFETHNQRKSLEKCISDLDLRRQVKKCVTGPLGKNLLYEMGKKTDALSPEHTFIPWITVNGIGSTDINDKANENLMSVVCDEIKDEKPDECVKNKRNIFSRFRQNYL